MNMSFKGFYQHLCSNGHYWTTDVYEEMCPRCGEKAIWENIVDITNSSFDECDKRVDGHTELVLKLETKCSQCGNILERTYKIPKGRGKI